MNHFIINHGGGDWQRTQASMDTVFSVEKKGEQGHSCKLQRNHKETQKGVSFHVIINLSDNMSMKMTVFSTPVMPNHCWHPVMTSS